MRFVRHGLVFILIVHAFLVMLIAYATTHTVFFQDEACIKPYQLFEFHTCAPMHVLIDGDIYVVPQDFTTDLASIPRPLWSIFAPQFTGFIAPAILHDYLYSCGSLADRQWADEVFYSALIANRVAVMTAIKFYLSVRLFGGANYIDHVDTCMRVRK
jgi:hypothetical protein